MNKAVFSNSTCSLRVRLNLFNQINTLKANGSSLKGPLTAANWIVNSFLLLLNVYIRVNSENSEVN